MSQITNANLQTQLTEVKDKLSRLEEKFDTMNGTLRSEIGTYGSIVMDLQKKQIEAEAVEKYKSGLTAKRYTKLWMEVGKQILIILGILTAILYAYASTKGIK